MNEFVILTDTYRNGAGTARQEYRTLWGICFVLGEMRVLLSGWGEEAVSENAVSVPIGLDVYLKENAHVVGRMPKNSSLHEQPSPQPEDKPGLAHQCA